MNFGNIQYDMPKAQVRMVDGVDLGKTTASLLLLRATDVTVTKRRFFWLANQALIVRSTGAWTCIMPYQASR